jgi:hypothetical protein
MMLVLLYAIAFLAGRFVESKIDGKRILNHLKINHAVSITIWSVIFALLSLPAMRSSGYFELLDWNSARQWARSIAVMSVPLISCMALFSTGFRIGLNKIREHVVFYISPSSWYDYIAISLIEGEFVGRWIAKRMHWAKYTNDKAYKENVHRAGSLLYLFEAIAYVAGGTFTVYMSIHGN